MKAIIKRTRLFRISVVLLIATVVLATVAVYGTTSIGGLRSFPFKGWTFGATDAGYSNLPAQG